MSKFILPSGILKQHSVVLGKTGSGKSSALRYVVEHLLDAGKRVCVIDPKGDWFGLKASADGRGPGYPVILFGDFKSDRAGDVPINQHSGKHVAELITSGNRPCVIGFRGWMTSHMVQFWIDFAAGIFNGNSGELFLVGDEFHNFAPKGKIMDPQAGKCLHWSNRLLSEGRGLGIVCLLASQRPQKVHNDTLTSCETLIAMRVVHAADRGAVEDWIKGCGDKERGKEVLNSLAGMARGEAFVWSPEIDFGPKRVKFPMFETFDSFAPPQLQKKVDEKGWADVDLEAVKEKLSAVIERAKQDDPKALRTELAKLRKELEQAKADAGKAQRPPAKIERIEVPTVGKRAIAGIQKTQKRASMTVGMAVKACKAMTEATAQFMKATEELGGIVSKATATRTEGPSKAAPMVVKLPPPAPAPRPATTGGNGDTQALTPMDRAILKVLAQHPDGCRAGKLVLLAGYTLNGSTRNSFSRLRTAGFIHGGNTGTMHITQAGLDALGDFEPLPLDPDSLARYWLNHDRFTPMDKSILRVVIENPDGMEAAPLCEAAGYTLNGSTRNSFSRLRTAGLIVGRNTETIKAAEELLQ